jgi:sigma-70-like protein
VATCRPSRTCGLHEAEGPAAESLAEVFRSRRSELVRLGAFILGDRSAAEDVVQDVFLRMYQRMDRLAGTVGPIAVSQDGSRIAFNAANRSFVGPGGICAGGTGGGAAVSVIDLASGKSRTWQMTGMPPTPAGTGVTPGAVSWMADGRTLAVSYVWPASTSGPQLSVAVAALDTTTDSCGSSLRVLWSQTKKCVLCVQEALISPDGNRLTATATQQTAHGYRAALLRSRCRGGGTESSTNLPRGRTRSPPSPRTARVST